MRILFDEQIFSTQRYGGVSRYYTELVKALNPMDGITAKLLSPLCTNHHARNIPRSGRVGIPCPSIAGTEDLVWYFNKMLSNRLTSRFKPDVLHQTYYPNRQPPYRSGVRTVTTVHDMIHEVFPDHFPNAEEISARKIRAVETADLVICVSESTRNDLLRKTGINESKTTVVHHGADHLQLSSQPLTRPDIKPYLLYVGLRHGYKNFQRVLKAYARSHDLMNHFDLVCFGGGALSRPENLLIEQLNIPRDKIILTSGDDMALSRFYHHAETFLCPSLYEGFGFPPLEAMLRGCPVVSSNVSSLPEVLGDAAEYFDPLDTDEMLNAITRVVNDPKRSGELKTAGYIQAGKFTWKTCARQTLERYQSLF